MRAVRERRFAVCVVADSRVVRARAIDRIQVRHARSRRSNPVIAVPRQAHDDLRRRDLRLGERDDLIDPGQRRNRTGRARVPAMVVDHQLDPVGGGADRGVVFAARSVPGRGVARLRVTRDRQLLSAAVQLAGKELDERREIRARRRRQVFVVDVDAVVRLRDDELSNVFGVRFAARRCPDHVERDSLIERAIDDVLNGGKDLRADHRGPPRRIFRDAARFRYRAVGVDLIPHRIRLRHRSGVKLRRSERVGIPPRNPRCDSILREQRRCRKKKNSCRYTRAAQVWFLRWRGPKRPREIAYSLMSVLTLTCGSLLRPVRPWS